MSTLKANRYENTASSDGGIDIDSSGKVGVGVASPDGTFHIHTASAGSVTAATGADDLVIENSGDTGISILAADGNNTTAVLFGNATDNLGAAIRWNHNNNEMSIGPDKSGAHLRINSGDGAEACRVLSGGGLTFNGDTAAANALTDYEEGTFSPTYVSGLTSDTYANTGGHYTKIGNFVTFTIRIAGAGTNSGSEQVQIGNLPFTASSSAREGGAWFNYRHDLDTGGAPFMHITQGGDDILWYGSGGSSWVGSDGAGLNNKTFHIQGFYYTDS